MNDNQNQPPPARFEEPGGLTLADLAAILWRRKLLIVATIGVITLATAATLQAVTPRYSAEALIVIESGGFNIAEIESVATGLPTGDEQIADTELQILRSRGLIEKVIDRLDLSAEPEFNPALRKPGPIARWREQLGDWIGQSPAIADSTALQLEKNRSRIVAEFKNLLTVSRKPRSRVISVMVESRNPETAAKVANALADRYISEQIGSKLAATQQASTWLNERIDELRANVMQAEAAVETFREQSGLLQTEGVTLLSREISEQNSERLRARTERAAAAARLEQVEKLLKSGGVDSVAEVLGSDLIQKLRAQEAVQQGELAELSQEYGERHPRMINLRAEAEDLQAKIRAEVDKIVAGIRNELSIAQSRERALENTVKELKDGLARANTNEVQLRALEREANANRTLLATFLARTKETDSQQDSSIQQADARIISYAGIPYSPSFPRKLPILALAFVAGTFLSLLLVFVREQFDRGYRSSEQVLDGTGLPVLTLVPKLKENPTDYITRNPGSALGESMRTLRTRLGLLSGEHGTRSLLVTSASPKEGKTALATCLAQVMALDGHRVLIVDADMRVPSVHHLLKVSPRPGLSDVLRGSLLFQEVVQTDPVSGALVITAGSPAESPLDLLQSTAMDKLLKTLKADTDAVIIDSPPTRAVSDAAILSAKVDATVFAIRWARTRREAANYGLQQLRHYGQPVAGIVLSMVDVEKHARYGFSDSGSYTGDLRRYYTRTSG